MFVRLAREGSPAAREAVVARFMPLARQLARRYQAVAELEDLEQVAAMGLVKAIDRFDLERGLAFSSYAFPTIVGELKRYLRDLGWSVRVPRTLQELYVRLERETADVSAQLGREPTAAELAERVGRHGGAGARGPPDGHGTARRVARRAPARRRRRRRSHVEIGIVERGFAAAEASAELGDLLQVLPPGPVPCCACASRRT